MRVQRTARAIGENGRLVRAAAVVGDMREHHGFIDEGSRIRGKITDGASISAPRIDFLVPLSLRLVEEMLLERAIVVSYETSDAGRCNLAWALRDA